jgi:HAD superfamily hydrolase (TIGR01509 family)
MNNKKNIAALFDLDGVVFNTEPQYTIFWGSQCKLYHPEIPDLEYKIKGQTLEQIYNSYFNDVIEEQSKITERLNIFEKNMHFDYVDGFLDFIKQLKENGVKTAVVTSSNKEKMERVYNYRPEFRSLFDAILTSEMFSKSKPDPDCYLSGATIFNTIPTNCVVFEDSFNGLKSGNAAGMAVVGLATTNSEEEISTFCTRVIKNYCHFRYSNFMDLL